MIPSTVGFLDQDFEIETQPSLTYKMDLDGDSVRGLVDEQDAMKQMIFRTLQTERYGRDLLSCRMSAAGISGASRKAGFGEGTPQQVSREGQNRRIADFGTVVETCSKKLPLSSAALVCGYTGLLHQYSDCGGVFCPLFTTTTVKRGRFGKRSGIFFVFPVCSLQQSGGVVCQRFLKMGAKKAVNLFKIYCLSAAVMGGGIKLSAVFQMEFICNRFLSAFQFLFCNLP